MPKVDMTKELGVIYGRNYHMGDDDFLPQLRGSRAIKKYDEMRLNDAVCGAFLLAMGMLVRRVKWKLQPAFETPEAQEKADFVQSCFDDMDHTFEDFISNVLTFLPFGYSFFERVYKRRGGLTTKPETNSQFNDGFIGIRKLAYRPQSSLWNVRYDGVGEVVGFEQSTPMGTVYIPMEKGLMFKVVTEAPLGRSVLRNAYKSYHYLSNFQEIEAIAVERELNGLPVGRIPAEYLSSDASDDQKAVRQTFEKALRDVKLNDQGFLLLPSDTYQNDDGSITNVRLMDLDLITSNGTRAIDVGGTISRYQGDIARTVLADFIMLGQSERGSFALSKSKSELFLMALEGYIGSIAATLNRKLIPDLWAINGFDNELQPLLVPDHVAPVDLDELGNYITRLAGAGAPLFPSQKLTNTLLHVADLPEQEQEDLNPTRVNDSQEQQNVADELMNLETK